MATPDRPTFSVSQLPVLSKPSMFGSSYGLGYSTGLPKSSGCRHTFSAEEDAKLKALVLHSADPDWKSIASQMGNRTARQCRERYKNYLSPDLSTRPWTETEDAILAQKVHEVGQRWAQISRFFQGRSDVSLKNRWAAISARRSGRQEMETLIQSIEETESPEMKSGTDSEAALARKSSPPPAPAVPKNDRPAFNIDEISWNSIGSAAELKTELNCEPNPLKHTFPNYGGRFW